MPTVREWTGREARALRQASRLSVRAFAEQLGVAVRTVSKWEQFGADVHPRPDTQAILDTALARADAAVHERFQVLLAQHYARNPHWPALRAALDEVLAAAERTDRLAPIAQTSTAVMLRLLGWPGTIHHSSGYRVRDGRSERLADLTQALGAGAYLCGSGGARYLDPGPFLQTGLAVEHFAVPSAGGVWSDARRISALSALMTVGPSALARELRGHAARWRGPTAASAVTVGSPARPGGAPVR